METISQLTKQSELFANGVAIFHQFCQHTYTNLINRMPRTCQFRFRFDQSMAKRPRREKDRIEVHTETFMTIRKATKKKRRNSLVKYNNNEKRRAVIFALCELFEFRAHYLKGIWLSFDLLRSTCTYILLFSFHPKCDAVVHIRTIFHIVVGCFFSLPIFSTASAKMSSYQLKLMTTQTKETS